MNWHPLAMLWPLMQGERWEQFLGRVQKSGGNRETVKYRVVNGEKQGLDGRNRFKACEELGLRCKTEEVIVDDDEVLDFILDANDSRRHVEDHNARRRIVEEMHRKGKSTRVIGEAIGVSHATVHRMLDGSTVTNVTEVNGQDGKKRKAQVILHYCDKCTRLGPQEGCVQCKKERKEKSIQAKKEKRKARLQASELKDSFGNVIPKNRKATWADPWIQAVFDDLCKERERLVKLRIAAGMEKRAKHYPHFKAKDFIDGMGTIFLYLDKLIEHIKERRPAAVCPKCEGKGCPKCKLSGLVFRGLYEELSKVAK